MNHSQEYAQLPPAKPELGRYFYNTIIVALILLCLLSVVLFYQINKHSTSQQNYSELLLPASSINDDQIKVPAGQTCLIVYSSDDENSPAIMQVFEDVLHEMRVGYAEKDLKEKDLEITGFKTVIIATDNYGSFSSEMPALEKFVEAGGNLLIGASPDNATNLGRYADFLGIEGEQTYSMFSPGSFVSESDFMVGGGHEYTLVSTNMRSMDVKLTTGTVKARTADGTPLVWTNTYGSGTVCVTNINIWASLAVAYMPKHIRFSGPPRYSQSSTPRPIILTTALHLYPRARTSTLPGITASILTSSSPTSGGQM